METETSFHKCPKCGAPLLKNGDRYWCSFVGGDRELPCDYGISEIKTFADIARYHNLGPNPITA